MTRWLPAAILGVVASLVVPVIASAQSLAEVAAREKERREAAGKKVKSYSEDDLRRSGGAASNFETSSDDTSAPTEGAAPAEGAAGDDSTATAPAAKDKDALLAEKKAYNEKLQRAQDELNGTATEIEKIQKDLGNSTGNYYSASRTNMLNRLDELTKKYAVQKDALEAVRAEGRAKFGA